MNDKEFRDWCRSLHLSKEARDVISSIRGSEPARSVESGPFNVGGIFNKGWKMGCSIQFESHTLELPAIYTYEEPDNDVIEYWDQPNSFTVHYKDRKGKSRGHRCTPDFFVLRRNSAGWEEWKTEEKLIELSEKNPHRFSKDEGGQWHFLPGEQYAEPFGLYFRVRSSAEINFVLTRNSFLCHRFFKPGYKSIVTDTTYEGIKTFLRREPQTTLSALLAFAEEQGFSTGCVYELIATKRLYVNLQSSLLTEPDKTYVYLTKDDAQFYERLPERQNPAVTELTLGDVIPGTNAVLDNKPIKIIFIGSTLVSLDVGSDAPVEMPTHLFESYVKRGLITGLQTRQRINLNEEGTKYARRFSTEDRKVALERYHLILPALKGEKFKDLPVTIRTAYEWLKKYKEAEKEYGFGLLGLLPLDHQKGRRGPRLPPVIRSLMIDSIINDYENVKGKNISAAYGKFRQRCKANGIPEDQIPAYSTYRDKILERAGREQEESRKGAKAAYKYEEFYWYIGEKTPPHGDHPWQICHIDHTLLDILLIHSKTFKLLGRPVLTLLTDAFSRLVLAFYLSFDRPSRKALMMIMRDCARRNGRLPELVVVDKGPEFRSVYFDSLLAHYECDKKIRPTAKARFGTVIERMFGITNTQFIHNLMGNTKPLKIPRMLTKKVNPENWAIWNYGMLAKHLDAYFTGYNNREHPALDGLSPQEAFDAGLRQFNLPYKEAIYDRNFQKETMVEVPGNTRQVLPYRGIKYHYLFYNSPALKSVKLAGANVEVLYDPYDASTVSVYVNNSWEEAYAHLPIYNLLKRCSEKDLKIMSEELRQRRRKHAGGFILRSEDVAKYVADAEEDEEREYQRKLDAEAFGRLKESGKSDSTSLSIQDSDGAYKSHKPTSPEGLKVYHRIKRK